MIQKVNRQEASVKEIFFCDEDYAACVADLIGHEMIWSMENYTQHVDISCLEHSFYVSYLSYLVCKRLKLDYISAARGGLLHDFFLYDWHGTGVRGLHGIRHPRIALQNANMYFDLNAIEKDIICKHMWPLTIVTPLYKESSVVALIDKYCACMEMLRFGKRLIVEML